MKGMVLKPEYQALADAYEDYHDRCGCTCHLGHPPCGDCTHEGHPISLEETPEAWEDALVAAVRRAIEDDPTNTP